MDIAVWVIVLLSGICIGISKTGISTLGMVTVVLLTLVYPAKEAIGIMLPVLIVSDVIAVVYYRRTVVWRHLLSLIPWVLVGLVMGYAVLELGSSEQVSFLVGILILLLVLLQLRKLRGQAGAAEKEPSAHPFWFGPIMGVLAGFATMIGNVSGIIMTIYLLSKKLPKNEFVGTGAWFFLAVNVIKLPLYVHLGLIHGGSIILNLWMVPMAFAGAAIGIKLLSALPQRHFQAVLLLFGGAGAIRLIVMGL
ncbi:sulfite exporter TauE/SafE family protein [Paenibacillus turpanensis]|uniref:sulfite exporter TauE/SafE family protein n=1 Tax=Paenibacillus turpanensis TaxID=2689078 RepID=UPI00140B2336|nr:sulfite exporter TauE/SafE family protein [Paenibacillus turpanensis]